MALRVGAGRSALLATALVLICTVAPFAQTPLQPPPGFATQLPPQFLMMGYRTRTGETFRVRVKAAVSMAGRDIWGTDVYTDDSDIEAAVVHAGLLTPGQEGDVLVTFLPGQNQYTGSTRNGVTTGIYDSWPASYRLSRADANSAAVPALPAPVMPVFQTMPPPPAGANIITFGNFGPAGGVVSGGIVSGVNFFSVDEQSTWHLLGGQPPAQRANLGMSLMALRNRVGDSFEFEVTGAATGGTIWGDGVYTDDSDLSVAAVHGGLLQPGERGRARITILPGAQSYPGTLQNGVRSQSYGSWEGSYRLEVPPTRTATSGAGSVTSISGRITDTNGRPVTNASVAAAGTVFRDGRRTLAETNTAVTNANGEYSLSGIRQGSYLIMATPTRSATTNSLPAYFPGVAALDAAAQIPIRGGEQIVGIDFTAPAPTLFKVSGKVSNVSAEGVQYVSFAQRDSAKASSSAAPLLTNASSNRLAGEFELMLPPGEWDVFPITSANRSQFTQGIATVPPAGVPAYKASRISVDVSSGNLSGLEVALGAADISGRVVLDPAMRPQKMEVRLAAADGTPAPLWHHARTTPLDAENRFRIAAVPPGDYRIEVFPAIPNSYVSDIRVGQASIFSDGILRVKTEAMEPIEVILSAGGGTVQGEIRTTAATASAKVVLVPTVRRRRNALLYKQESIAGASREFRFSNVPPGEYKVFVFDNLPSGAEMNAEFLSKYELLGESITVAASGVTRVSARMIEAEK